LLSSAAATVEDEGHSEPDRHEPVAAAGDVDVATLMSPASESPDRVALQRKALFSEALKYVEANHRKMRWGVSSRFGELEYILSRDRDNSASLLCKLPVRNSDAMFLFKMEWFSDEPYIYAGQ